MLLTSPIVGPRLSAAVVFFPVLVSTIGVGFTFRSCSTLPRLGQRRPRLLRHPRARLADRPEPGALQHRRHRHLEGRRHRHADLHRRHRRDPARSTSRRPRSTAPSAWQIFRQHHAPAVRPATATVIMLSLIGGLRSFDIIWATTGGGPGSAATSSLGDLQAVPGRLLRPLHRGQRGAVPRRHGDHGAAHWCLNRREVAL